MDTDELSSLANSVPQKILFIGGDLNDFLRKLQSLQINDEERFNKLWGVCTRLQFVEHLLHSVSFAVSDNITAASNYYAERTAAYLAATCIDIIAGKKYKEYPKWLAEKLQGQAETAFGTEGKFVPATPNKAMQTFISLSEELYAEYQQERGIGSNFKRIIRENCEWLTDWLIDVYFIAKGEIILQLADISSCSWVKYTEAQRLKRVAEYLFELRNLYTHNVDYRPSLESGGSISIPLFNKRYVFNSFHEDGDLNKPVEMSVGLLEGLAESDVIRLIVTVELRKWLNFKDDRVLLEQYWKATRHRKTIYACVRELKENYETVHGWYSLHLSRYFDADGLFPIRKLQDQAALALSSEASRSAHYMLEPYLQTVKKLNSQIGEIEKSWTGDKHALVNKLTQADELWSLMYYIRDMYRDLLQSVDFAVHTLN